jgi:hypothetical protein
VRRWHAQVARSQSGSQGPWATGIH